MTKINQISTTTTRTPSTFGTNTKFATIVWYEQINKLRGFNYAKKFLQHLQANAQQNLRICFRLVKRHTCILQCNAFIHQSKPSLASEQIARINAQNFECSAHLKESEYKSNQACIILHTNRTRHTC